MFGIYQQRHTYWAHAKPVRWVRKKLGLMDLSCGTSEDWAARDKFNKAKSKTLDWLTDDLIDIIQNFLYLPYDIWKEVWWKINARFFDQYWMAKSNLPRWQYHEVETRMLHCNFQMLVDFVEIEKANMQQISHKEIWNSLPWYVRVRPFRYMFDRRSPVDGMAYLDWEKSLMNDDEWYGNHEESINAAKERGEYGNMTKQAESAKEIQDLYLWWTAIRPARPDSYEASGYNAFWKANDVKGDGIWDRFNKLGKGEREMFDAIHELEAKYDAEDDEMLERLIKVRRFMWT